jgi:hypothetical protein
MVAPEWPQPPITWTPIAVAPIVEPEVAAVPVEPAVIVPVEAPEPEPEPMPVELPHTASPLPLVGLGGSVSLLAGLGLRLVRRRPR